MTESTDTEHVPGQLPLPSITIARGVAGGPLVPATREELTEQLEALDMALLQHRTEAVDDVAKKATSAADAGHALDHAVSVARGLGATWEQIGAAAGMTRQSAWRRWSTPDEVTGP